MNVYSNSRLSFPLWNPPAEGSPGGDTGGEGESTRAKGSSMFAPGEAAPPQDSAQAAPAQAPAVTREPATSTASKGTQDDAGQGDPNARPDWLKDKYKTAEEQAKAYNDLYASYSKKTETLREEIAQEYAAEQLAAKGVPGADDAYAYPENITAPAEHVDGALQEWARANNVSQEAFDSLINDVWGSTMPDPAEEMAALGEDAEDRINSVNNWITANINDEHNPTIERIMTTAEGVAFMESIADALSEGGLAPTDDTPSQQAPLTREGIRELQYDPKFGVDDAYTAHVRGLWARFAAQGGRA